MGILLVIAVGAGILIDKLKLTVKLPRMEGHLIVHEHDTIHLKASLRTWKDNFRPVSFTRVLLISGLSFILLALMFGFFEHDHSETTATVMPINEAWFNNLFAILGVVVLLTFFIVDDHFLEEHLWKHVVRQHVPKIAIWTFIALTLIHLFMQSVDLQEWIRDNSFWMLILAVLVGVIPESGPHLIFVTLFLSGNIPLSILLANAITQDGHASLPLLAESKRGFLTVKLINVLIGIAAGGIGLLAGF